MHYEVYVDSLFLVNFVMNLYLLLLVDRSTLRTATPGRLAFGAALGASCAFLPLLLPGSALFKTASGAVAGTVGMLLVTFPVKGIRMFLKLLERLLLYSFLMGGVLLFLIRRLPMFREFLSGIFGVMGVGGVCFLFLGRSRAQSAQDESLCRAWLKCGGICLEVTALMDSGNSLIEPISGKPVCIVEKQVLKALESGLPTVYRAIPYHSIGKSRGILEGYLLPELRIEVNGISKSFQEVYIAAGPEGISEPDSAEAESVKMIISPMLLAKERSGRPKKRQNERIYDTESSTTGKNAF